MIHEIKEKYELTLLEFVMKFKLEKEFEKQFEVPVHEWDGDMYDEDVVDILLETHRPENNYIIIGREHQILSGSGVMEIIEI